MDKIKKIPQEELINLALIRAKIETSEAKLEAAQAQLDLNISNFKLNLLHMFNRLNLPFDCKISEDGTVIYPESTGIPPLPEENNHEEL